MKTKPRDRRVCKADRCPCPQRLGVQARNSCARCAGAYRMSGGRLLITFRYAAKRDILLSESTTTVSPEKFSSPCRNRVRPSPDSWTRLQRPVSLALQRGVSLEVLCSKFTHVRFEPSGWTGNPKIGFAKSIVDYIFRWLELKFLTGEQGELFVPPPVAVRSSAVPNDNDAVGALGELVQLGDAPACNICGALMVRSGNCYRCMTCGSECS